MISAKLPPRNDALNSSWPEQWAAGRLGCGLGSIVEPRKENKPDMKYMGLGVLYMMGLSGVAVY